MDAGKFQTPIIEESNCVNCDRLDSDDNLVQCDKCDAWWHMSCAGVSQSIENRQWLCVTCLRQPGSIQPSSGNAKSKSSRLELKLRKLSEQYALERKFLDEKYKLLESELDGSDGNSDRTGTSSAMDIQPDFDKVRQWIKACADVQDGGITGLPNAPSSSPHTSRNRNQRIGEDPTKNVSHMQRDTEQRTSSRSDSVQPDVHTQSDDYIPTRTGVKPIPRPRKLAFGDDSRSDCQNVGSIGPPPLAQQPGKSRHDPLPNKNAQHNNDMNFLCKQFEDTGLSRPNPVEAIPSFLQSTHQRFDQSTFIPTRPHFLPNEHLINNYSNRQPNIRDVNTSEFNLTPSQLAARQVMPRDLPIFSGNPTEWPVFISSFRNSTLACGYSNAENLARLQRCLKGQAYAAVQSRLLLPESVPYVIDTLHLLYGRPEILINALLERVRSVPAPKVERLESFIDFGMAVQSLCDHLEAADQRAHLTNPSLLSELVGKLPGHIKMQWGTYLQQFSEVNLKNFANFMSAVVISVSKVTVYASASAKSSSNDKSNPKIRGTLNTHVGDTGNGQERVKLCNACQMPDHRIVDCGNFKQLSVDDRWKLVQDKSLCRTCLNDHGRRSCRSSNRCGLNGCQYRHHHLLHSPQSNVVPAQRVTLAENLSHRKSDSMLFFRIVPVTLHGPTTSVETYAFMDEGSSMTLIEDSLARQLGAYGDILPLCLLWTGNVSRMESESRQVELNVSAMDCKKQHALVDARTVKQLSLPKQTISLEHLVDKYPHLKGIPVQSYQDAQPLSIGINNLNVMLPLRVKEGRPREPVAAKTRLGWCIYGGNGLDGQSISLNCHSCGCNELDSDVHETVKSYFALEDVGAKAEITIYSRQEERAMRILEQTTVRLGNRFETGLLWKHDHIEFPDSYAMVFRRLECLERRMSRDLLLRENIQKQLCEYEAKRYAHRATPNELAVADLRRVWYLPLGTVFNPRKSKVRLIWDGRAQVDGMSFNSVMLKGPDQLSSLPAVLMRFRQFRVGVTADIREMFHQISIRPEDRDAQRFLWRKNPSAPVEIYIMDVATFGSACSPATAQFIKNKNANEYREEFPRAAEGIVRNHYVDDSLESYDSIEDAVRFSKEMRAIHEKGGFDLRNWLSNCDEVLISLGESTHLEDKSFCVSDEFGCERVLGLLWITGKDDLAFSTELKDEVNQLIHSEDRPTKRQILKCLMAFFDPLGLLGVILVHGKILLQEVWRSGILWDERVNDSIYERWRKWTLLLTQINQIRIPRCYFEGATSSHYHNLELHIFVDASELAYSAAAYFRVIRDQGETDCILVMAKTKVAPLKPLSVPRLELLAAVLGARLMKFVEESHTLKIKQKFIWSDSATVLAWLKSDARRYKQYVACRIGELLALTNVGDWRWVPSKLNSADEATKWGKCPLTSTDSTWFKGPNFLRLPQSEWPRQRDNVQYTNEELRPCHVHRGLVVPEQVFDLDRFSKYTKLLRVAAYVHRFIDNMRRKRQGAGLCRRHLESEELRKAENTLIRLVQWQNYPDELVVLNRNKDKLAEKQYQLESSSVLYQMSPMLDESGILRIDGRIGAAPNVKEDTKFPIILPRNHRLTHLVLDDYHCRFRHANAETIVNEIRQRYYVPHLRASVKKTGKACQWCKVYRSKAVVPRMAPLPPARMATFTRPFTYVGLDFFGPFTIKVGRSDSKRWIALFTCMTTRAVHVEVAHSLSTESCIKCIRRFVCRRGSPAEIYSDNGTNFVGADKQLKQQMQETESELIATFTNANTKWFFNPPGTPHMGGSWERLVRSIKTALEIAYNNNRKLNEEGLETLVIEAEGIVNSRPLTYLPLDSDESEALTPNHFLLGSSNGVR
ncbi:uncharacterized protein LOC134222969 [Armigeres subalbatus]|uniref:uncharacterized protein LOC134222969 n=1 Tax=Armigeres subalbatus TaxID=124917 RepID=UPI002ED42184